MEKRTVVKRVEIGADGGGIHVVLAKQIVETCEVTKQDADGNDYTEPGERLLVDEPHRVALYPLSPEIPAGQQASLDAQVAEVNANLARLGYPPIPVAGIDQIKRLIAAL